MAEVRASAGVPVIAQFSGLGAPPCAPLVVDSTTGFIYAWTTGDVIVPTGTGGMVKNSIPAAQTLTIPSGYSMVTTGDYTVTGDMIVLGDWAVV
jgi:hypothetical protein